MRSLPRLARIVMPLALISIGVAGCQTSRTRTSEIDARTVCALTAIIKYSRDDTAETRRQIVMNNAALAEICK